MGMMGKALLQRASESVLHAEKRRLLWGAEPAKAIGYSGSVSCSPVIPDRYRNPSLPDVRYLFVANRSDFYSGCCTVAAQTSTCSSDATHHPRSDTLSMQASATLAPAGG